VSTGTFAKRVFKPSMHDRGWPSRPETLQGPTMLGALEEYSAVVGQIYDASLDVSAWERTLEATCRFVGASKAALAAIAPNERRYQLELHVGYEPGWIDLYHRTLWAARPPARRSARFFASPSTA
jgi:hypothetical protein